jgi:hypothetical protein
MCSMHMHGKEAEGKRKEPTTLADACEPAFEFDLSILSGHQSHREINPDSVQYLE